MGLRVVGIDLYNCGKKPIRLHGHPELTLLGDDGVRADVEVRHGSAGVTGLPSFDAAPRPVTVRPHGTASSGLVWRLLVEAGAESVTVDRVVVGPAPGLAPQRIDGLHVDVGTTRLVGLSPWRAHER